MTSDPCPLPILRDNSQTSEWKSSRHRRGHVCHLDITNTCPVLGWLKIGPWTFHDPAIVAGFTSGAVCNSGVLGHVNLLHTLVSPPRK